MMFTSKKYVLVGVNCIYKIFHVKGYIYGICKVGWKLNDKKGLKAVLLASTLGSAAFVAPVMAEENS